MKASSFFCFFLLKGFFLFSQQNIKGTLVNAKDSESPVAFALIVLTAENNKIISTYSDDKGKFEFQKIIVGKITLKASCIGFQTFSKDLIVAAETVFPMVLSIQPDEKVLSEVAVVAQKKLFEQKVDRLVVNIEGTTLHKGNSIWETLGKMPGVRMGLNDEISVAGKSVLILINDKAKQLSPEQIAEILKGMSSDELSKIEIIHNPPAKYDAQGGAIINLISKKNTSQGWNAQVRLGYTQATYPKYFITNNLSWRSKKMNITAAYSYKDRKDFLIGEGLVEFPDNLWKANKRTISNSQVHTIRTGLDYSLSQKHTIGTAIDIFYREGQLSGISNVNAQTKNNTDSIMITNYNGVSGQKHVLYNLYYKANLDTLGQLLTIDFDWSPFQDKRERGVINNTFLSNGSLSNFMFDTKQVPQQQINIASAKVDYHLPKAIFKSDFDAGIKYNRINVDNNLDFYRNINKSYKRDMTLSNLYLYQENVIAAYINLNGNLKSWGYQVGFRGENTSITTKSDNNQTPLNTQYFRIFPSIYLNKMIDENNQINLYWGRRIVRPEFWRLNAFRSYNSPFDYTEGNPLLQPEYPQSVELKYTYQQRATLSIFTNYTNNFINNFRFQDNKAYVFINTYKNLGKSIEYGCNLNYDFQINNNIQSSIFTQLAYKEDKVKTDGIDAKNTALNIYISSYSSFVISKDKTWKGDINLWYGSASVQGINQLGRNGEVSLGIKKSLLKNKAMLGVNFTDILYTNVNRTKINYNDQKSTFLDKTDSRSFTITFAYRFGNIKMKEIKQRKTSSEDTNSRLIEK